MAILNHEKTAPPNGFQYLQRETGSRFEAITGTELVDLVIAHRRWKKLEPTDPATVWLEIQRQICSVMAPGVCQPEPGETYQPFKDNYRNTTSEVVMAASRAAIEWLKTDSPPVTEAESDRRARICHACPLNRRSFCACTPVYALIDKLVPKSRAIPGLAICGICQCSLKVKVLAPVEVIRESNRNRGLNFPKWCWQSDEALELAGAGDALQGSSAHERSESI